MNPNIPVESWTDIIPSFLKMPYSAYKNRKLIQYWWKRLVVAAGAGNTNIVVLGRPAVGKSVLVSTLFGEANELSWNLPDSSKTVESKAISFGEWARTVKVIPGQSGEKRTEELNKSFSNKDLDGLIYVVNFGYTGVWDSIERNILIEEEGIDTMSKIQQYNLEKELKDFERICDKIEEAHTINKGPKWILIVVNKADLFSGKRELVKAQKYYHPKYKSKFTDILHKCLNQVGKQNMKCAVIPISAFPTNFEWNGKVRKTNLGGKENEKALFKHLVYTIGELYK